MFFKNNLTFQGLNYFRLAVWRHFMAILCFYFRFGHHSLQLFGKLLHCLFPLKLFKYFTWPFIGMRVSRQWLNLHFWVNYLLKSNHVYSGQRRLGQSIMPLSLILVTFAAGSSPDWVKSCLILTSRRWGHGWTGVLWLRQSSLCCWLSYSEVCRKRGQT